MNSNSLDKIKTLINSLLDDSSKEGVNKEKLVDEYSKRCFKLAREIGSIEQINYRYYLTGVDMFDYEHFLVSELSVENAYKTARKYLSMVNGQFKAVKITTADGSYKEQINKGE